MNYKSALITGVVLAAFCGPLTAASKKSPSPAPSGSPAATTAASPAAKPARATPFRGNATAIDKNAKTFTIGKTTTRVIKVTDQTTIMKGTATATFADITDGQYVTGSYMKQADGSMEAKSVKIGGKSGTDTGAKKKAAKDESEEGSTEATSPAPSASPKKK